MSCSNSTCIIPTNDEPGHLLHSENQSPANQDRTNGYHLRDPGMPMKALWEALKDDMGLNIIIAIIADPRCGIERRVSNDEANVTYRSSPMFNIHGEIGCTPLMFAVIYFRADVVRTLLEGSTLLAKRADGNVANAKGHTPLHFAAMNGHAACAELLIANGANLKVAGLAGQTPLHFTALNGHTACAELLIAKGADVNASDRSRQTPLHFAARFGHIAYVELILANGADPNVNDTNGYTPLHAAAEYGNTACAEFILATGADVNATCPSAVGRTPLHAAARYGYTAYAELLISEGADAYALDFKGQTPLHLAAGYGHTSCAELFHFR